MLYVVKLGGGAGIALAPAAQDIAELVRRGEQIVLLHGCSGAADQLAQELGVPVRYVTSTAGVRSRYTDARSLRIFVLAAGLVNTELVGTLQRLGVPALGLSGLDGGLLCGSRKETLRIVENGRPRVLRGDFTGRVERVNVDLLRLLLDHGYVPTIAPLALAAGDACENGREMGRQGDPTLGDGRAACWSQESGYQVAVNVDGDRAAAAVAVALHADLLIILSNVPGLLADARNERSLIQRLAAHELMDYERQVTGGMRRKLMAAREAWRNGVPRVVLADGRVAHPLRAALAGGGTVIA